MAAHPQPTAFNLRISRTSLGLMIIVQQVPVVSQAQLALLLLHSVDGSVDGSPSHRSS